ncbi:MAG: hypothetical protein M1823_002049 [Watsoniomyces obsoletus]|nr:MAG: hypothetical protein M1823_002049 [Watsoniomyces obsoletus]
MSPPLRPGHPMMRQHTSPSMLATPSPPPSSTMSIPPSDLYTFSSHPQGLGLLDCPVSYVVEGPTPASPAPSMRWSQYGQLPMSSNGTNHPHQHQHHLAPNTPDGCGSSICSTSSLGTYDGLSQAYQSHHHQHQMPPSPATTIDPPTSTVFTPVYLPEDLSPSPEHHGLDQLSTRSSMSSGLVSPIEPLTSSTTNLLVPSNNNLPMESTSAAASPPAWLLEQVGDLNIDHHHHHHTQDSTKLGVHPSSSNNWLRSRRHTYNEGNTIPVPDHLNSRRSYSPILRSSVIDPSSSSSSQRRVSRASSLMIQRHGSITSNKSGSVNGNGSTTASRTNSISSNHGGGGSTTGGPSRRRRQLTTPAEANHKCDQCGKLFERRYNYRAHLATHDPERIYAHTCQVEWCDKKFVRKTDLMRHHQSVHLKQRNFRCELCGHDFARKDTLHRHRDDGCSKRFEVSPEMLRLATSGGNTPPTPHPHPHLNPSSNMTNEGGVIVGSNVDQSGMTMGIGMGMEMGIQQQQYQQPNGNQMTNGNGNGNENSGVEYGFNVNVGYPMEMTTSGNGYW